MARLRALVVDDEEGPLAFLEELMRGRGHEAVSARSLEEATAALEQGPFDLVVMDLNLPVSLGRLPLAENGYQLEAHVRARLSRPRAYLIVLTGKGLAAMDSSLAHDHGCDAYVLKGDRARLLAKLAEGEAQARARQPSGPRPKGDIPLKARSWSECTVVLGRPARARTRAGGEALVEPSAMVEKVLYHLQFSEGGSDLRELAADANRRSLARDARKFLRAVFEVRDGPTDPVPYQRARKAWTCLVQLQDPELERGRVEYEERRRRDHTAFEEDSF